MNPNKDDNGFPVKVYVASINPPPAEPGPHARATDSECTDCHRKFALWTHLAPLISWITVAASGGLSFMIPGLIALAMWQMKKDESPFLDDHGREALNFQISMILLGLLLIPIIIFTCGVGVVLLPVLLVLPIVGGIMGTIAANKGQYFRYPMCIRLIKEPNTPTS